MASEDWYVPGAAIIETDREIRLRPPEHWTRVIIEIPRMPPSMNSNEIRSHWRGFQKHKKQWQEEIGVELAQVQKVKRGYFQRAIAGAFMRLPPRAFAQHPDRGNYSSLIDKALGDALVVSLQMPAELRFIPDDDAKRYVWGGVEFEDEPGAARTRFFLYLQPKEENDAPHP